MSGESYSHSSFPAVSNQGSHLFFKSSKLHTKLRQHGRMDFFAGKEAYRVIEKERSSLFFVYESGKGLRGEDRRTIGWLAAADPLLLSFPSSRGGRYRGSSHDGHRSRIHFTVQGERVQAN